jgi:hypothetical protein
MASTLPSTITTTTTERAVLVSSPQAIPRSVSQRLANNSKPKLEIWRTPLVKSKGPSISNCVTFPPASERNPISTCLIGKRWWSSTRKAGILMSTSAPSSPCSSGSGDYEPYNIRDVNISLGNHDLDGPDLPGLCASGDEEPRRWCQIEAERWQSELAPLAASVVSDFATAVLRYLPSVSVSVQFGFECAGAGANHEHDYYYYYYYYYRRRVRFAIPLRQRTDENTV